MTDVRASEAFPVTQAMKDSGGWNPLWDGLSELDPEWTELYMKTAMQPWNSGCCHLR